MYNKNFENQLTNKKLGPKIFWNREFSIEKSKEGK